MDPGAPHSVSILLWNCIYTYPYCVIQSDFCSSGFCCFSSKALGKEGTGFLSPDTMWFVGDEGRLSVCNCVCRLEQVGSQKQWVWLGLGWWIAVKGKCWCNECEWGRLSHYPLFPLCPWGRSPWPAVRLNRSPPRTDSEPLGTEHNSPCWCPGFPQPLPFLLGIPFFPLRHSLARTNCSVRGTGS